MNHAPGLETKSSGLAVFLSLLFPGLGQLYVGRVVRGSVFILGSLFAVALCFGLRSMTDDQLHSYQSLYLMKVHAQDDPSRFAPTDQQLDDISRTGQIFGMCFLVSLVLTLALWIWGMADSARLCGRFNADTFARFQSMRTEAAKDVKT